MSLTAVEAGLAQTFERVEEEARRGSLFRGATVVGVARGETAFVWSTGVARNDGLPSGPDVVWNVWCGVKPLSAFRVAARLEARGIAPDDDLRVHHPLLADFPAPVSLADLSCHRVTFESPLSSVAALAPPAERGELVRHGVLSPTSSAYGEYATWWLLADLVDLARSDGDETGRALADNGVVLHPLLADQAAAVLARSGIYFDGLRQHGDVPVPLIHDLGRRMLAQTDAGLGGRTSARGLAQWYSAVTARPLPRTMLGVGGWPSAPYTDRWLGAAEHSFDEALTGRTMKHVGPFMAGFEHRDLPGLDDYGVVGQLGWMGASLGIGGDGFGLAVIFAGLPHGSASFLELRAELVRHAAAWLWGAP